MYTYETVTEAVSGLKGRGFTEDFNLEENCLVCNAQRFHPDEFEITETYRFEGPSDPGDEAVVYGISSQSGLKGVLVNGYGYQSNALGDAIARKLSIHR
jgi:hypothetical protein